MTYQFFGTRNQKPDFLAGVRESWRKIATLAREIAAAPQKIVSSSLEIVRAARDGLLCLSNRASASFDLLSSRRQIASEALRGFIVDNGLKRPMHKPNRFTTVMVTQGALLTESLSASTLLIADGATTITEGIGYGVIFALLTVGVGMATGYFACRWIGYRLDAPFPRMRDRLLRIAGWCGFAVGIGLIGGLGFSAARVRATGGHADIWNFETVSLAATFSDYFALALPVVALLGATLAIHKGISGIEDSYPGYQAAAEAAETQILEAALNLRDDRRYEAETIREDALDALDDDAGECGAAFEDRRSGKLEHASLTAAHNRDVEAARELAREWAENEHARTVFVSSRLDVSEPPGIDDAAFDAWLIAEPPPDAVESGDGDDEPNLVTRRAEIEAAFSEALGAIEDAYGAFLANAPLQTNQHKGA